MDTVSDNVEKAQEERITYDTGYTTGSRIVVAGEGVIPETCYIHTGKARNDYLISQRIQVHMKFIDLFAGVGGFHYGVEASGIQGRVGKDTYARPDMSDIGSGVKRGRWNEQQTISCVYANEWDKYANSVYRRHFGECDQSDIRQVRATDIPDHDLLCGGFPCQAFSIAGKRGGFDDTRGTLFFDIARILKAKQPRLCLLENVKGLLSHDNGRTIKTIFATLVELGYDLQWQVCNSKDFGVPQNRERIFIIGHLRGTPRPQVFPIGENRTTNDRFTGSPRTHTDKIAGTVTVHYAKNQHGGQYLKETKMRIRRLTPIEYERLQGFPDDWTKYGADGELISDTQRYKMMGNAVTTNVITAIARKLLT